MEPRVKVAGQPSSRSWTTPHVDTQRLTQPIGQVASRLFYAGRRGHPEQPATLSQLATGSVWVACRRLCVGMPTQSRGHATRKVKLTQCRQLGLLGAVGQEPIVPDTQEPGRQEMM